jgi:hypothetical protein
LTTEAGPAGAHRPGQVNPLEMKGETQMRSAEHGASRPTLPRPVRTVPPYHTGKVQIGLTYVPRQRPHHDRDACRLQEALLTSDDEIKAERAELRLSVGMAITLVVVVALLAGGWL